MIIDLPVIASPANNRVKFAKSLQRGRVRHREGCYLLEGIRLIEQALNNGGEPVFSFILETLSSDPRAIVLTERMSGLAPAFSVSEVVIKAVSVTETPQGIVAVMRLPVFNPQRVSSDPLILVLDQVTDPGNLGTILRCAQGSGFDSVLLSRGCVDPFSPKVVRAGMGAQEYLNVARGLTWPEIRELLHDRQIALAHMTATATVWDVDWRCPTALIVGNEAHGVSTDAQSLATMPFSLPMLGGLESLNAAVAASISMFEAVRQRRAT